MLRKFKIFLLAGSILLIIAIVIVLLSRNKTTSPISTIPNIFPVSQSSKNTALVSPTASTSLLRQSDLDIATKAKKSLLPKLPITIADFPTSVGINTDIYISSYADDSPEMVRVEIYGLDYQYNQNDPQTNPNMVAFKESFEKVKSILTEDGANISDLHISLSNKKYIRDVAEIWIKTLNLLP